jgi:hypothetical protein
MTNVVRHPCALMHDDLIRLVAIIFVWVGLAHLNRPWLSPHAYRVRRVKMITTRIGTLTINAVVQFASVTRSQVNNWLSIPQCIPSEALQTQPNAPSFP